MPVSIKLDADGLWAWLVENPGAVAKSRLVTIVRKAQKQAFREWCTQPNGSSIGLRMRFTARAFAILGLYNRTPTYQKRQIKSLGQVLPYVAPSATKTISGGTTYPGQMRNLVTNGGYAVQNKNDSGETVTTQLSVTGANILNQFSGRSVVYRQQFLGFGEGGKGDAEWIKKRTNELTTETLMVDLQKAHKRSILRDGSTAGEYSG